MIHKEAQAARKAATKPDAFQKWQDEFYVKHQEQLAESLECPIRAANAIGWQIDQHVIAADYVTASCNALLETAGSVGRLEFSDKIESLMAEWESTRAAQVTENTFSKGAK
jgi:hypothetical protein